MEIDRHRITAAVGADVVLWATVKNEATPKAYTLQWCRQPKYGANCTPLAGATTETYVVPAVNLGNDGDAYTVTISDASGSRHATAVLTVSSGQAAVFTDGDFSPSAWSVTATQGPAGFEARHFDEQVLVGGEPDAFRRVTYQALASGGDVRLFHTSAAAVFDPAVQGAVRAIDFELDCARLDLGGFYTTAQPMIEQAGRRYVTGWTEGGIECLGTGWRKVRAYSVAWFEFAQLDGPACAQGEQCPDFAAGAAPIRLGFETTTVIPAGTPLDPIVQGIDNWKATLWRP